MGPVAMQDATLVCEGQCLGQPLHERECVTQRHRFTQEPLGQIFAVQPLHR
jgi:hypothetical protein